MGSSFSRVARGPPCSRRALERLERRNRSLAAHRSGIGTWLLSRRSVAGCRGVNGPVPRPLSMSAYWTETIAEASRTLPLVMGPDAADLADRKRRQGVRVSVCLPARNEAATIGPIVATVRRDLVEGAGLVDEVLVLDDGSIDATAELAEAAGARVVTVAEVLPDLSLGEGKGHALWTALYVAEGGVVCFLDAGLRHFPSRFVTGLVGPLLVAPAGGL